MVWFSWELGVGSWELGPCSFVQSTARFYGRNLTEGLYSKKLRFDSDSILRSLTSPFLGGQRLKRRSQWLLEEWNIMFSLIFSGSFLKSADREFHNLVFVQPKTWKCENL